jgi:hypothetical protein
MTHSIVINDPLPKRIVAWMNERFPFANALLFFVVYLTSATVARSTSEQEIQFSLIDLIICLITWSFFLVIRIFDEHKDYKLDVLNHPGRVLQSGLITLTHLKVLAVISICVQLVFCVYIDGFTLGAATLAWMILFSYLCLMGVEFFCGKWLEKRLALYAFTHMLIMPLIVFWLANIAIASATLTQVLTTSLFIMMLLAFVSGFCFEIARKTRGPEEERDTVDSYSKIFGTKGSAYVVMVLIGAMLVCQIVLLINIEVTYLWVYCTVLLATFALAIKQLLSFVLAPSLKAREKNEAVIAINMLIGYLVVIVAVTVSNGIAWSLV